MVHRRWWGSYYRKQIESWEVFYLIQWERPFDWVLTCPFPCLLYIVRWREDVTSSRESSFTITIDEPLPVRWCQTGKQLRRRYVWEEWVKIEGIFHLVYYKDRMNYVDKKYVGFGWVWKGVSLRCFRINNKIGIDQLEINGRSSQCYRQIGR